MFCRSLPALFALLAALAGCHRSAETPVVEACVKLASYAGPPEGDGLRERCVCVDKAANRYLDTENYAVLKRASVAIIETDNPLLVLGDVVGHGQGSSGALAAAATAGDFLMLTHKVSNKCI